jgi:hypothetical protein
MAVRWAAHREPGQFLITSLFSRFSGHLRTIHANHNLDPSYQIDRSEPLYKHVPGTSIARVRHWASATDLAACLEQSRPEVRTTRAGLEQAPVPPQQQEKVLNRHQPAFYGQPNMTWDAMHVRQLAEEGRDDCGLLAISQSLLDPDFTTMDRIVSFDEMMLGNISETWDLG